MYNFLNTASIVVLTLFSANKTSAFTGPLYPLRQKMSALDVNSSPLPDLNYGLSDVEFHSWLLSEIENVPGRDTYANVYEDSITAIVNWRKRFRGNPVIWKRVFKKDRVIKELIESAPIIQSVKRVIESNVSEEKFTILDLCCGKGYLSMFLSEILPQEKVERFILVDKAWAIASKDTKELKPHQ